MQSCICRCPASLEYDSAGNLIGKTEQGDPIATYGYTPQSAYQTQPLWKKTQYGYAYYHRDHLGTPIRLTDKTNATLWEARYKAFGERNILVNAMSNALGFPGQYYDEESGFWQNWFRDYDPATGRYIQSDSIGLDGGLNTYLYAYANPMKFVDLNGSGAIGFLKCMYYTHKIRKYMDQCDKEYDSMCKNDPFEGGINFISKYDSDWMSGALSTCTCKKAADDGNSTLCTDWITSCAVVGVGGGPKPRPR